MLLVKMTGVQVIFCLLIEKHAPETEYIVVSLEEYMFKWLATACCCCCITFPLWSNASLAYKRTCAVHGNQSLLNNALNQDAIRCHFCGRDFIFLRVGMRCC